MSRYVVLVVDDDEDTWEQLSEAEQQLTYDTDARFAERLKQRGGAIVGGAELAHSRGGRVVRRDPAGDALVTDGPFAETAEQLSGFYVVECDSLDDLTDACQEMLAAHVRVEIRPCP